MQLVELAHLIRGDLAIILLTNPMLTLSGILPPVFLSLFSRADTWQRRLLLQRLFVDLFCRFCLPVSPSQLRQSDQQVPLFKLKLFTKRLVIALGPGPKHRHLPVGCEGGAAPGGLFWNPPPPVGINHLQQAGQRGDVPPPHIHDS